MAYDCCVRWFCTAKPLIALLAAQLVEEGRLALDQRVKSVIPEFSDTDVTFKHVLTHTTGLVFPRLGYRAPVWLDDPSVRQAVLWAERYEDCIPGTRAAYNVGTTWVLLGWAIERLRGGPLASVLRERVLEPMGLSESDLVVSEQRLRVWGRRYVVPHRVRSTGRIDRLSSFGADPGGQPNPGWGGGGPLTELAEAFRVLRDCWKVRSGCLVEPATLRRFAGTVRSGVYDEMLGRKCDYGLGFMVDLSHYGFGSSCSKESFGHLGEYGIWAFADPERDLAGAILLNGAIAWSSPSFGAGELIDRLWSWISDSSDRMGPTSDGIGRPGGAGAGAR